MNALTEHAETFQEIEEWIEENPNSKFEPEDVDGVWAEGLEEYVRAYTGSFDYLVQMKAELAKPGGSLSRGQLKGVANCWRADYLRAKKQAAAGKKTVDMQSATPAEVEQLADNGMYTIVHSEEEGDYRTLRLKNLTGSIAEKFPKGTQVAEYLSGPDNEASYTGFAFVQGERIHVWKRFKEGGMEDFGKDLESDLSLLLEADFEEQRVMGEAYALRSNNCCICGRALTVPISIGRGMGPVCFGKLMGEELDGDWSD